MPRARSRRSSIASVASSGGSRASTSSSRGPGRRAFRASGASPISATSCCCAPSWRLRSSLRRVLVLRVDQPLPRRAELLDRVHQLLGERHVAHHQPCLRGQVADELLLGRRDRVAGLLLDRQRAEELALMPDRLAHRRRATVRRRRRPTATSGRAVGVRAATPPRIRSWSPMRTHTSARIAPVPPASARAIRGRSSSFAYAFPSRSENSREHLVRCRALPVDEPVGEPLRPAPHRLERERDDRRGDGGQDRVAPGSRRARRRRRRSPT